MNYHTLSGVQIPEDVIWEDERKWSAVESSMSRGLTGKPVVQAAARINGRPVTLASPDPGGWVSGAVVDALRDLESAPAETYALTLADGRTLNVMFRPGEAMEATPLRPISNPGPDTQYRVRIPLMTI